MTQFFKDDPYFDEGMEGSMFNFLRKHYWKVASWYEYDDFLQEALEVYIKVRRRFRMDGATEGDNRRKLQIYFAHALRNRITDLQQDPRSRQQEMAFHQYTEEQQQGLEDGLTLETDLSDIGVVELLARAPADIVDMLKKILIDGVTEVASLKTPLPSSSGRRTKRWLRETTSQRIDRCLGHGASARLREYLTA